MKRTKNIFIPLNDKLIKKVNIEIEDNSGIEGVSIIFREHRAKLKLNYIFE